jgi:hypothetical protein
MKQGRKSCHQMNLPSRSKIARPLFERNAFEAVNPVNVVMLESQIHVTVVASKSSPDTTTALNLVHEIIGPCSKTATVGMLVLARTCQSSALKCCRFLVPYPSKVISCLQTTQKFHTLGFNGTPATNSRASWKYGELWANLNDRIQLSAISALVATFLF